MNFFILRHGLAAEPTPAKLAKDSDRPLTPKGERKLRKIARAMQALDLSFDCILSSPYRRARQTAEIVAECLGLSRFVDFSDILAPAGNPRKLLEQVQQRDPVPDNVLIVGHEPYLSELISLLLSGDTDLAITMKKAGLCKLVAEAPRAGQCARLEWLLTPKQMCLIA